jgi:hypothetical protein
LPFLLKIISAGKKLSEARNDFGKIIFKICEPGTKTSCISRWKGEPKGE